MPRSNQFTGSPAIQRTYCACDDAGKMPVGLMLGLRRGAVIILDDAARPREQTAIARWRATFPDLELVVLDTEAERGIAVLLRHGGARRRLALRAVLGTFREQWSDWRKRS